MLVIKAHAKKFVFPRLREVMVLTQPLSHTQVLSLLDVQGQVARS